MLNDLTNVKISSSYGRLVQVINGSFYDGFGVPLAPPTNESASYAISSSYASTASYSVSASYASTIGPIPYRIVSSSYTINLLDSVVEIVTPFITASLPTAVGNLGKEYSVINVTTGSIMILASGSQTIGNDATTNDGYILVSSGDAPRIISNNTKWRLI